MEAPRVGPTGGGGADMTSGTGYGVLKVVIPVLCVVALLFVAALTLRGRKADPGSGHIRKTAPADRQGTGIEVYSGMTGNPIAGAKIRLMLPSGPSEVESDEDGWVPLESKMAGTLRILAKGHVGQEKAMPLPSLVTRIYLTPTGSVQLSFHSREGQPVPGVVARLERSLVRKGEVPQDTNLLLEVTEGEQRSDARGTIVWAGLIPGTGYTWKVVSQHPVMDEGKPGEVDPFKPTPPQAGFQSGYFEVPPGRAAQLKARVGSLASVSGAVALKAGEPHAIVRLFHNTVLRAPPGQSRPTLEPALEKVVESDGQGTFRIPGVRPGKKTVQISWRDGAKVEFVEVDFDLAPDEARDLGALLARKGNEVSGRVRLVGRENLPKESRDQDLQAVVEFVNIDYQGSAKVFAEKVLVKVDEPFVLTGLATGDFQVSASIYLPQPIPQLVWTESRGEQFEVPDSRQLDLEVTAKAKLEARLTVVFPTAQQAGPLRVLVFPALPPPSQDPPDADPEKVPPSPPREFGFEVPIADSSPGASKDRATATFPVTAGTYTIWATSAPGTLSQAQLTNFFGEAVATFAPGETNEVTVVLGSGAIVRGRAFTRSRQPYSTLLMVQADPFIDLRQPYIQTYTTDGSGTYVIKGLPPSRRIRFLDGDTFQIGGPESETPADLILRN